jgi:hypothetical protein
LNKWQPVAGILASLTNVWFWHFVKFRGATKRFAGVTSGYAHSFSGLAIPHGRRLQFRTTLGSHQSLRSTVFIIKTNQSNIHYPAIEWRPRENR